ncbi:MAG: BolA/IbaG family iron-sulfur metabolism protein [Oscillatoriaceae bacterium SKW80]|nr:BolA/IbaG family iron-sulfur metabolism protein [Oscillatoriaceae bacterium SKYG93]MCX8120243.1 BolA/IbaG family iron-sulfur metabolism protein [Oscillatoriaceae bacterium SKW80]MDW8453169.1 BolA/IbaG family iron-sulfur metabolism protein [Oscillatoriaceae cyanobacterium SKYGB_i_bin93]HIK28919.1 BolA/IbaG family iron-sulfur metabolism protein [Oscillatoriaceae cyanobacterium M7585_C2015_266]
MVSPEQVKAMIEAKLPNAQVQVNSNDGEHFEVTVISPQFEGKRLVQQHQMVYAAVQEAMSTNAIHALALKTYTPQDWIAASQSV